MAHENFFQNLLHGVAGIPGPGELEPEREPAGNQVAAALQPGPAPELQAHQQAQLEPQAVGQQFSAAAAPGAPMLQAGMLMQPAAAAVAPPAQQPPLMVNPSNLDLSQLAMQVAEFQQLWQQQQQQQQGTGSGASTSAGLAPQMRMLPTASAYMVPPHQTRQEPVARGILSLTSPSKPAQKKVRISEVRIFLLSNKQWLFFSVTLRGFVSIWHSCLISSGTRVRMAYAH